MITLEQVKWEVLKKYKAEDQKCIFLSLFDGNKNLLASNGVISTDKPLGQIIDILYNGIVAKHPETTTIVADIVTEITPQTDVATLLGLSTAENGVVIVDKWDRKSGVMIPGTTGIADMKTALSKIKEKYGLAGDVEMYTFRTDKIAITK